nr:POTRA domain, FtsQ-type [uncultured bacterium]
MKIFSTHRKKLEPKRRFGSYEFRTRVREAANYKRAFTIGRHNWHERLLARVGLASKFGRRALIIAIVIIIYYLFFSSKFAISNFEISGNTEISTDQIQTSLESYSNSRFIFVKKNNFFLMTHGRISKALISNIPKIKTVETERIWPNTIKISIQEHVPGFVIKSNEKLFLVDDEGVVVSPITDPKALLVVEDQLTEDFASGEVLRNSKLSAFVLSMHKQWSTKISTPISLVKFPGKESSEVQFVSREGWSVMFDTSKSAVDLLNQLAVLLNKQVPIKDRINLAYIDLRLENKAYYCFKAAPCAQQASPETAGAETSDE